MIKLSLREGHRQAGETLQRIVDGHCYACENGFVRQTALVVATNHSMQPCVLELD